MYCECEMLDSRSLYAEYEVIHNIVAMQDVTAFESKYHTHAKLPLLSILCM